MKTRTLILIFILCTIGLRLSIPAQQSALQKSPKTQNLDYMPDPKVVRFLAMGHIESFAGLMWIQTVNYFGEAVLEAKSDRWLADVLILVSTLDPKLRSPYFFAGVLDRLKLEQVEPLLNKGITLKEDDWQLHLFYAFKLITERKDYANAAKIMERQKENPKAPPFIQNIYKRYLNNAEDTNLEIILTAERFAGSKGAMQEEAKAKLFKLALGKGLQKNDVEKALEMLLSNNKIQYNKGLDVLTEGSASS